MTKHVDDVPQKHWTKEELADFIDQRFLRGTLPSGSLLPSERILAESFGTSRPFIREVLVGLQQRGLVEIRPGRGAFVREVDINDIARTIRESGPFRAATPRDLVEARITLEKQTTALATQHATEDDLRSVERALTALNSSTSLVGRARADIAFHMLLARASANPVLEIMYGAIAPLVFELMLRSLGDPETMLRGAPYHQQVLDAMKQGDAETAVSAMAEHILLAAQTFGEDYDKQLDEIARQALHQALGHTAPVDTIISDAIAEFTHHGLSTEQQ